jgi:hypothetical protein
MRVFIIDTRKHGSRTARRTHRSRGILEPDGSRKAGVCGRRQPLRNGWVGDRRRPVHSDRVAHRAHRRNSVRALRQPDQTRRIRTARKRTGLGLGVIRPDPLSGGRIQRIWFLRVITGLETQRVRVRAFVSEAAQRSSSPARSMACRMWPGAAVRGKSGLGKSRRARQMRAKPIIEPEVVSRGQLPTKDETARFRKSETRGEGGECRCEAE